MAHSPEEPRIYEIKTDGILPGGELNRIYPEDLRSGGMLAGFVRWLRAAQIRGDFRTDEELDKVE